MLFKLSFAAWAAATVCFVVAKLAGFGEAAHEAFLIMALTCGAQIGIVIERRRRRVGGGR